MAHRRGPYLLMAIFFVLTTPGGVALGLGIKTTYNENSPTALGVMGVFDSISSGILIYMALVRRSLPTIMISAYRQLSGAQFVGQHRC